MKKKSKRRQKCPDEIYIVDEMYLQFYFDCFFFYKKMELPPEIICMAKSSLPSRDLYYVDLICRYLYWCSVSNKEWQLRKCNLWKKSKEQIVSEFSNARVYCSHVICWKYRCQYLSLEGVRSCNNEALRWAAMNGHLPVVQYLCEKFQLTIQDVRSWNNDALGGAAESGHLPVVKYLCETYSLTTEDVRSANNEALRMAVYDGHLPVVQYLCEKFQLTIQDARSCDNFAIRWAASGGHLPVVKYLCEKFELTLQDVRSWNNFALREAADEGHLSVVQYLHQKFSIDE
jgi:hypothetical protein